MILLELAERLYARAQRAIAWSAWIWSLNHMAKS